MKVRGIRGAISVEENTKEDIYAATKILLERLIDVNELKIPDICSIIFTVTDDLNAAFPAVAARKIGLNNIPMLCLNEMPVAGSLKRILRILIHVNTNKDINEIKHVYLKDAKKLRPDLAGE